MIHRKLKYSNLMTESDIENCITKKLFYRIDNRKINKERETRFALRQSDELLFAMDIK